MTTFQDPQPQSRRVARQSERSQPDPQPSADPSAGFTQFPSTEQPAAPQVYSEASAQADMWDTISRRAAQLPPTTPQEPVITGRRAAAPAPAQPAPTAEPLTYTTQSRAPQYEAPALRPRASREQSADLPPTQAIPQADQPAYRVRDFSPEARRTSPDAVAAAAAWQAAAPAPSDLEYHTQNRAPAPQPVAPAAAAPAPAAPASDFPEQTFSRREMRAMLHAEEDAAVLASGQSAPVLDSGQSAPVQYSSQPVAPVQQAPVQPAPVQPAPAPAQQAAPQPAQAPVAQPQEPVDSQAETVFPFSLTQPEPAAQASPLPSRAPEPETNTALTNAISEFDALTSTGQAQPAAPVEQPIQQPAQIVEQPIQQAPVQQAPVEPPPAQQQPAESPATGTWTPPVGHWSTQADINDENELYENTLNRTIGTGSATTSALVLPVIPVGSDIRGALTGTGEIMLTGSIDLPHSYSSTGASDRFEHGGIDSLFDMNDADVVSTDSAPVRAIRAVSTHNTSGHGVTHTQKPKGTRALTALLIAASSMAVVVAGLLVAAFAFNVF
ncbi:hypothetical protein BH10ACT7_BH10ACT7_24590 [soil metagenome]